MKLMHAMTLGFECVKQGSVAQMITEKSCVNCKATKTPLWRSGPAGPKVNPTQRPTNIFYLCALLMLLLLCFWDFCAILFLHLMPFFFFFVCKDE